MPSAPYRLLAVDLDGTLVRRDGSIVPADRAAIEAVRARGVRFSIVTGRLWSGVRALASELGVRAPVVCGDGAEIRDPVSGRVLASRRVQGAAARDLRASLAGRELAVYAMAEDRVRYDARGAPLARYIRNWTPATEEVEDALDPRWWGGEEGLAALVAIGEPEAVEPVLAALRADGRWFADGFAVRAAPGARDEDGVTTLRGLLAHAAGVDKGRALVQLCELLGMRPAEAVVVGDWVNDIPMFRAAGRGFAMAAGPPEVRAAASDQLLAEVWKGGGVAEAVARIWGC